MLTTFRTGRTFQWTRASRFEGQTRTLCVGACESSSGCIVVVVVQRLGRVVLLLTHRLQSEKEGVGALVNEPPYARESNAKFFLLSLVVSLRGLARARGGNKLNRPAARTPSKPNRATPNDSPDAGYLPEFVETISES